MALPLFNFSDRNQQMMQSQWASQINPVLANPLTSPRILKNIALTTGVNVINTGYKQCNKDGLSLTKVPQPQSIGLLLLMT